MHLLKRTLDPLNILNPGRVLSTEPLDCETHYAH
jgi:hypothetical protein